MEVREGYKQTDVGVIPDDWEVKELGKLLFSTQLGGNYPNSEKETSNPLIKMGNLNRSRIDLTKLEFIKEGIQPLERDKVNFGDVLFNTRNTLELVGKVAIWKDELVLAYFNSNIMRLEFKPSYVSSNFFMNYILNTPLLLSQLRSIATGTTSVAAIYTRDLIKIIVPIPTKAEQTAIAEALSGADALIQSLTKLIAKKCLIKQGAMQELLTGKRRLPGFERKKGYKQTEVGVIPEDWEVKVLGEIANINMGQSPSSSNYNNSALGLPLVQGNADIQNRKTIIRNYTSQITKKCNEGDIIMSVRAPVGEIARTEFAACIGRGVCAISYPNNFIYHYLIFIEPQWAKHSTGSTFDSVNSDTIRKLEIPLPPTKAEQTAIATILSDMDAEIAALETKLEKYREIKQGMMQELLTGRIRLV